MKEIKIEMKLIRESKEYPIVVHGTYYKFWNLIKNTGLKTMTRQHVHFAKGLPGDSGVISGMCNDVEILIYVDVDKMLQNKIELYESDNGVILSSGVNGTIYPEYFKSVVDVKTKKIIFPEKENK